MADLPDVSQMAGPRQNQPSSGTYGVKAANDELQSTLTQAGAGQSSGPPPGPQPRPMSPNPVGQQPSNPGALPSALMNPTQRPNVPVSAPLQGPPGNRVAGSPTGTQARIALLQQLQTSPTVSDETREYASTILKLLLS